MQTILGELSWTTSWWMVCVTMLILVGGLLWWGYGGNVAVAKVRAVAISLKFCGFALLVICLLEPLWRDRSPKPGANLLAVVVDESRSLQILESDLEGSRAQQLKAALTSGAKDQGWLNRLEGFFQLRRFTMGTRLSALENFEDLKFEEQSTSLQSALKNIKRRFQGRPLAGVLLFTDGGATDLSDDLELEGLPPIFPVLPGSGTMLADLSVTDLRVSRSQFEDSPVTLQAKVSSNGLEGRSAILKLIDESGVEVSRESQVLGEGGDSQGVRFRFRPEKPGFSFYKMEVSLDESTSTNDIEGNIPTSVFSEATQANNTITAVVDRGGGPFRILYVSGRPNWEFKFLRRALQEEDELDLVGLIRIAKKEARFDFRGRTGESSNPLFRGFGEEDEDETEQYDEAVLVRMNTRDADELARGFPKEAEELFSYHAVIVDDLEADFFKTSQQALLEEFVSRRGGGFLMLGGLESFREGNYARTPVGRMLPIYLHPRGKGNPAEYRWKLTREGWLMPWARLRSSEVEEQEVQARVPPFRVANLSSGIKPGAIAVTELEREEGEEPLSGLIGHRFGRGRVMALTVGDIWRWGLRDPELQDDMARFWRQCLRRLVADVPDRISVEIKKSKDVGSQAVDLEIRAFDEEFKPLENVEVRLKLTEPIGGTIELDGEPSSREAGLFVTSFLPKVPGVYRVEVKVLDETGNVLGEAQSGWVANFEADEFRSLEFNQDLLARLARETGGEVVDLDELDSLADRLPELEAPVMEIWSRPLWHNPWVFFCALGLFGAEWLLRRMKGLP